MKAWILAIALGATVGCGGRLVDLSEADGGAPEHESMSNDAGSDALVSSDTAPSEASACAGYSSGGFNPYASTTGSITAPPIDCSFGQGKP
jgi:hypothetical protein